MTTKSKRKGVIGKKRGMTRVFTDDGVAVPVTVIEVESNRVSQVKTKETDGYDAIQVTAGSKKRNRVSKPEAGHFAKAGIEAGSVIAEFPLSSSEEAESYPLGSEIKVDMFEEGQIVDATGTSIGKGFAGVIKRHNFNSQPGHGNSLVTRAPGSIGQCQTPGRVFKGKKMAGQMGNKRVTVQNQKIVRIDAERNLIMIKGAVPGAPGSYLLIRPAVKMIQEAK